MKEFRKRMPEFKEGVNQDPLEFGNLFFQFLKEDTTWTK
jgi:hypothetical protein